MVNLLGFLFIPLVFSKVVDDRDVSDTNYLFDEIDIHNYDDISSDSRDNFKKSMTEEGFAHCVSSKRTAPIDIDLTDVNIVSLPPLQFDNYDESESVLERIQLHTYFTSISGVSNWTRPPVLSGGPLRGEYRLMEINWDFDITVIYSGHAQFYGHTIQQAKHSFEVHFLHTKDGIPVYEAQQIPDGIAMVVAFIDLDMRMKKGVNYTVDQAVRSEKYGIHETAGTAFQWVPPDHFLPKDRETYFTYKGSFSLPPCTGELIWIILSEPLQWDYLENVFPTSGRSIVAVQKAFPWRQKTNNNVRFNNPKLLKKIDEQKSAGFSFTSIFSIIMIVGLLCFGA